MMNASSTHLFSPETLLRSNEGHSGRSMSPDRWALRRIQQSLATAPIRFVLWDGFELRPKSGYPVATITIRNRWALFGVLMSPDIYFGDAYMFGALQIEGDLLLTLEEIYRTFPATWKPRQLWPWPEPNGKDEARDNVHRHYDLGNSFYRLWLDREMLYTCAYFPDPDCSLEDAQIAKMDLICRKLRLRPGDRVIEAGCGWGALAFFMARQYGVSVRAFNLSSEQIAYARHRAKAENMTDRVEFIEDDYRNVSGSCDAFVSVGMLEHVGLKDFPTLGDVLGRSLAANGRALLHFIGRNQASPLNRWIQARIFPGAYPPTLHEVFTQILDPQGFSVQQVENLRLHYARTLDHWRRRFAAAADEVTGMFDAEFVRAWGLYLAGSQAAFTTGWMQLFQVVFTRADSNNLPCSRGAG